MMDEFYERHEVLGDAYIEMCSKFSVKDAPPVVWITDPRGVTSALIMWDDRPCEEIYAPEPMLMLDLLFDKVFHGIVGDRN